MPKATKPTETIPTPHKVRPLIPSKMGLGQHVFTTYSASVPGHTTEADLLTPGYWGGVANKFKAGYEVRVLAEDCSFRALLVCTYAEGTQVIMRTVSFTSLETVDYDKLNEVRDGFKVINMGTQGWCIQELSSGEMVKTQIPNQSRAYKELDDHLKMLAA